MNKKTATQPTLKHQGEQAACGKEDNSLPLCLKPLQKDKQIARVGKALLAGSVTSLDGFHSLGTHRLAVHISALRHKYHWNIVTIQEKGFNRYQEPTCYARYVLPKDEMERLKNQAKEHGLEVVL